MPSSAAAINSSRLDTVLRAGVGFVHSVASRPRDMAALCFLALASGAILINALHLQPGPHPAPIFNIKPRPVASSEPPGGAVTAVPRARPEGLAATSAAPAVRPRAEIVADVQRELSKRGLYEGPTDGVFGPKTDAAIRDFEQSAKLKSTGEPTEDLLRAIQQAPVKPAAPAGRASARPDPIAELIAPSPRVVAVQRALNDFGYGPVKATGIYGSETVAAIQKFERDRKLPVTGQISARLMRELAALTGRPLE